MQKRKDKACSQRQRLLGSIFTLGLKNDVYWREERKQHVHFFFFFLNHTCREWKIKKPTTQLEVSSKGG